MAIVHCASRPRQRIFPTFITQTRYKISHHENTT